MTHIYFNSLWPLTLNLYLHNWLWQSQCPIIILMIWTDPLLGKKMMVTGYPCRVPLPNISLWPTLFLSETRQWPVWRGGGGWGMGARTGEGGEKVTNYLYLVSSLWLPVSYTRWWNGMEYYYSYPEQVRAGVSVEVQVCGDTWWRHVRSLDTASLLVPQID